MSKLEESLQVRAGHKCELCGNTSGLEAYPVNPTEGIKEIDAHVLVCESCSSQLSDLTTIDTNHWRCLNDSMWSEIPAVQVLAWRMLHHLKGEGWPQDLLDMMYLDESITEWAQAGRFDADAVGDVVIHKDSNGTVLAAGDTVTLVKDLNVKGANFTAKRGTTVKNISLVDDNAAQIEGKINGQQIVILTQFVKKG